MSERPVPLRDLAKQLGLRKGALQHHEKNGKLPTYKLGNTTVIEAHIAQQVREWHRDNKNRTWPQFPLEPTKEQ